VVPAKRITVMSGSIAEPQFALPSKAFARLTKEVGIIFHLAAQLDFRSSFDKLRAVNVDGLRHVLSLAAVGVAKRIVYVSSLSVLETTAYYGRTVTEATRLIHPELLPLGYAQTKWTAEVMLAAARARGFEVLCLRPSWIVGHNLRGIETDFIASLVRIFAAVGATPDLPGALNLVPVDFVAEACALLGLQWPRNSEAHIFHLGAAEAKSNAHFAEAIATTGRGMDRVSLSVFLDRVSDEFRRQRSLDLMMFRHIFVGSPSRPPIGLPYLDGRAPVFDSTASLRVLQQAGLPQPALDLAAFARCWLQPPPGP
jgi:thioester reductase-like protein